jgi:hypothetical protein
MSFVEAISYVSENIFWLLALPKVRFLRESALRLKSQGQGKLTGRVCASFCTSFRSPSTSNFFPSYFSALLTLIIVPVRRLQRIQRADRALRAHMHGMIATRREEIKRGEVSAKHDLLNALIESSVQDTADEDGSAGGAGGAGGLSDDELVG